VRWRGLSLVVAVVLLLFSGCRSDAQKAEDLRAGTILKQSADYSRQR
jgi:hypothetical protein